MIQRRRVTAVFLCAALAATLGPQAGAHPHKKAAVREGGAVIVRWSEIAEQTIFPATPIPSGQVELGLVTMAMYDAVDASLHARRIASPSAAAAAAAHDVLLDFFPAASTTLAGHLTSSLSGIRERPRARGLRIGHGVAEELLEDREDDGFPGTGTFDRGAAVGVWRPTAPLPTGAFLTPWLGFMDPLVLRSTRQVDPGSPPALTSRTYALDLAEAQLVGSATSTTRLAWQTAIADFYNFNVPIQLNRVLRDLAGGMGVAATARLFGLANTSAADSIIACWREKYDEPLWRPITAIREADTDGNPLTFADKGWTPLRPTPPYPDWTSGHACLTSAYTSTIKLLLGNDTDIEVTSVVAGVNLTRAYTKVNGIRKDAFNARIWLGYHFRAAMVGGYAIGDETVKRLESRFPALR